MCRAGWIWAGARTVGGLGRPTQTTAWGCARTAGGLEGAGVRVEGRGSVAAAV